jgi:transposase
MTYSLDLINSAINYYKTSNLCSREVAKIFGISKSILNYWIKELPIRYSNVEIKNKITSEMLKFLKNSLNHNPFQTQQVMQQKINYKFKLDISLFIIKNMLKIIGYTKKKISRKLYNRDLKQHICKQKEFCKKIKKINTDDIICIDETGVTRDTYCDKGYCHKSKKLKYFFDISKLPKNRSVIVAINKETVIQHKILINKSANQIFFLEFIKELVLGFKNKYILMDNIGFHKGKNVIDSIIESGNTPLFIPPYSPEYNPIEEVFALFKGYLRKNLNVISGFSKLDFHITAFLKKSNNFDDYYKRSFAS